LTPEQRIRLAAAYYARTIVRGVDRRCATACHQAGHAIMAIRLRGWIGNNGVEIDNRQCSHAEWPDDGDAGTKERRKVLFALAGWRAEHLWHGEGSSRDGLPDDVTLFALKCLRNGWSECDGTDDFCAFKAMLAEWPAATDEELAQRYADFSAECYAILRKPRVREAVERVAEKLIERGRLSADEAARGY
jgi:hypothetical protein